MAGDRDETMMAKNVPADMKKRYVAGKEKAKAARAKLKGKKTKAKGHMHKMPDGHMMADADMK